ncbi:hypothetical protein DPX16_14700 [Anabarilius grahami]|uniref:Anosmin-1 cysteine rich domain-containing protein n=1 Tax=Anabarilius grahami TaxID=495550 RepID=A0A3N0XPT1_ANAGA|nr:hypothetical protein DPX16_14700 [Anabarilius grahami]
MMFMRKVCCFLLCCVFEASVARKTEEAETLEKIESARCVSRCLTLHITQITASFKHLQFLSVNLNLTFLFSLNFPGAGESDRMTMTFVFDVIASSGERSSGWCMRAAVCLGRASRRAAAAVRAR